MLTVARCVEHQPETSILRHPAFSICPGHEILNRDFAGSASIFSVEFVPSIPRDVIVRLLDELKLFRIGYSWGGVISLVMPHFDLRRRFPNHSPSMVRFNVGLEAVGDLIADPEAAVSPIRER